jgi:PAS domain S-box-containing protein
MSGSHEGSVGWERLFWSTFERSRNALALVDEQRVNVEVNRAMCTLLGVAREEIVGRSGDHFLMQDERAALVSRWEEYWESDDLLGETVLVGTSGSPLRVRFAMRRAEVSGKQLAIIVWTSVTAGEGSAPSAPLGELTPREREVVSLVALGLTSPEIAERLVISPATVKTHVQNAMVKTGARTRAHLVAIALADRHIVDAELTAVGNTR